MGKYAFDLFCRYFRNFRTFGCFFGGLPWPLIRMLKALQNFVIFAIFVTLQQTFWDFSLQSSIIDSISSISVIDQTQVGVRPGQSSHLPRNYSYKKIVKALFHPHFMIQTISVILTKFSKRIHTLTITPYFFLVLQSSSDSEIFPCGQFNRLTTCQTLKFGKSVNN